MKKFYILALFGLGDCLSAICRLKSVKQKYPEYEIVFFLGGFGRSPQLSKEQLELEGYKANIINNFTYHGQLFQIEEFLKKSILKEGDILEDWSFCNEIFNNQEAYNWKYEFEYPYNYVNELTVNPDKKKYQKIEEIQNLFLDKTKKYIGIKPLTKSGNAEGFSNDLAAGRFWTKENWYKLADLIVEKNHILVVFGINDEDWEICDYLNSKNVVYVDYRNRSVQEVQDCLKYLDAFIGTNSFEWEITSRHKRKIPTYCMFFKNSFFIENHVPHNQEFYDTCYIDTDSSSTPEQVLETVEYMMEHKKRPEIDYSIAMITKNDSDCIEETLNKITPYIVDDLVIVHGGDIVNDGVYDSTVEKIIRNFEKHSENIDKSFKDFLQSSEKKGIYLSRKRESYIDEYNEEQQIWNINKNKEHCYLVFKKWFDDFSIQKNYALSLCKNKWKILLDADEWLDTYSFEMLPWILWKSEKEKIDCISLSRINTLNNLSDDELRQYCQKQGWKLGGCFGNHINWPDLQRRIFYGDEIHYVGKCHEQITEFKKEKIMLHHPIHHHKSKERQEIGLKREQFLYEKKANEVYKMIYE